MAGFVPRSYDGSFLFNQQVEKHNRNIAQFIIKAGRIEKFSDAFKGIIEDIKRQQNTSILYTILMSNKIVLCIHNYEMPAAFKVFSARDIRFDKQPKIFIDCTGIIEFKDNYFYCKKIDILVTYLFNAMGYLLYNEHPNMTVSNSNISISGTECFVSLFTYILDYLRIIGYAQNKSRISYLAGLYFLHNMMSKDLDTYTLNLAAKVAGISTTDIKSFELYYNEEDFRNIDTFVTLIAETFKLKGLTTEVFVSKWLYLFGKGTQFGCELFTSFSSMITSAYCGSYIVMQKQIERCCGTSMVNYSISIMKLAVDLFDRRGYMENSELKNTIHIDKSVDVIQETIIDRLVVPEEAKFKPSDFESINSIKSRLDKVLNYYNRTNKKDKLSTVCYNSIRDSVKTMNNFCLYGGEGKGAEMTNVKSYDFGTTLEIINKLGKYLNEKDARRLRSDLKEKLDQIKTRSQDTDVEMDQKKNSRFSNAKSELINCINSIK